MTLQISARILPSTVAAKLSKAYENNNDLHLQSQIRLTYLPIPSPYPPLSDLSQTMTRKA